MGDPLNPLNFFLISLISLQILHGILGESVRNPSPNFPSNSPLILVSLTTQISPGVPLHQGSIIPRDSLQIPRDFARWVSCIQLLVYEY